MSPAPFFFTIVQTETQRLAELVEAKQRRRHACFTLRPRPQSGMAAWVYILRCADGSYYTGATTNIDHRLNQHHLGEIGYTAKRKPVEYLWSEEFPHINDAYIAEKQIKGWSRAKKEALMRGDWNALRALAKSRSKIDEPPSDALPSTSSGKREFQRRDNAD